MAAQGPTRETMPDFVRMLIQYNIKVVICACNEYEGNKVRWVKTRHLQVFNLNLLNLLVKMSPVLD